MQEAIQILQQLKKNQNSPQTRQAQLNQLLQQSSKYPAIQRYLDGKTPEQQEKTVRNLCKTQGVKLEDIMKQLGL